MEFFLENPVYLGAIPVLLLLLWWMHREATTFVTRWRTFCLLGSGFFLILAATSPVLIRPGPGEHRILLLDASDSVSLDSSSTKKLVDRLTHDLSSEDKVSVLQFGENSSWLARRSAPTALSGLGDRIQKQKRNLDRSDTRPAAALQSALQATRPNETTRFLLVSDGQFSPEQTDRLTDLARRSTLPMDTLLTRSEPHRDVWIQSVSVPERVDPEQPFEISVQLSATATYTGTIQVLRDNQQLFEKDPITFDIERGATKTYRMTVQPGTEPYQRYEVILTPNENEWSNENNQFSAGVRRAQTRQILVTGPDSFAQLMTSRFQNDRLFVQHKTAPTRTEPYDQFLIAGPADRVSDQWMQNVKSSVLQQGKGLIMVGQRQTFATGRWGRTPIEDVLPVQVYPPDAFSVSVILDVSGSMGNPPSTGSDTTRLNIAREALLSSLSYLRPTDKIQLISFAGTPRVSSPLQPLNDGRKLQNAIEKLSARGGTHLYPALKTATDRLSEAEGKNKYILIFSDAQLDESREQLEKVARRAADQQIRILVLTTGSQEQRPLLNAITLDEQNGKLTSLSSIQDLRETLADELKRIRRFLDRNGKETKFLRPENSSFLTDDPEGRPNRTGTFHRVTRKPAAEVPVETPNEEVLVAAWEPGEGRSVVLTPFFPPDRTMETSDQNGWLHLLNRSIDWTKPEDPGDWQLRSRLTDSGLIVDAVRKTDLDASGVSASGELLQETDPVTSNIDGKLVGTNRLRFSLPRPEKGTYRFRVTIQADDRTDTVHTPVNVPVAKEYLHASPRPSRMKKLARSTGGTYLASSDEPIPPVQERFQRGKTRISLMRYALMGAGLFLLLLVMRWSVFRPTNEPSNPS